MENVNMFELGTRMNLVFQTVKGTCSISDLWKLPLETLDKIAVSLNKELKESETVSFLETTTKKSTVTQLKFDIVRYIMDKRLTEKAVAEESSKIKKEMSRLSSLIQEKSMEEDRQKPIAELQKKFQALQEQVSQEVL